MPGKVSPHGYMPRLVDAQIERYLSIFGAVEITGTKWCGKTWSACRQANSITYIDEGDNEAIARADPSLALLGEQPHVIDEWQKVPKIWDTVRHAIDEKARSRGAWILTGSSTPNSDDDEDMHSGAGRFGTVRMWPMSLFESGDSTGEVSLAGLFEGKFEPTRVERATQRLAELCCRGGWPEAVDLAAEGAQEIARSYLNAVITKSIPKLKKNPDTAERLLSSLARNLCQAAKLETLRGDLVGDDSDAGNLVSTKTIADYLAAFSSMFLVDSLNGWAPPRRSPKRVQTKPKRYFADPSLAVAALGMNQTAVLSDWQTFGLVFENLCMRDLFIYSHVLSGAAFTPLRYYRDDSGLEADAIIEMSDGRWAALEIKLSEDKVQDGVNSLLKLRKKLCENAKARVREPEFLAVVVGISEYARKTPEGVYVLPITCLGA